MDKDHTRIKAKALVRGVWVYQPGDLVKRSMIFSYDLQFGEIAKILSCWYYITPGEEGVADERRARINVEIVEARNPNAVGITMTIDPHCTVPAGYQTGKGRGNGGLTIEDFIERVLP